MTSLPDWLVERAALGEVPPASRDRIERADPREVADRVAALREDSAAELTRFPAGPAVAQIEAQVEARIAEGRLAAERRRRRRVRWLGLAMSAAAVVVVARFAVRTRTGGTEETAAGGSQLDEDTRVKGATRLVAFRQVGAQAEQLPQDAVVRPGDVIQLRYKAGAQGYGVIASLDGAGVVTLHYPLREDAPPQATAVSAETTTLPHAYALDDAPRFERFFFITANDPVDVRQVLGAVRSLARRDDSATASLDLPTGVRQWSLRLRKPDRTSPNQESPRGSP